jgi:hypothetical protein
MSAAAVPIVRLRPINRARSDSNSTAAAISPSTIEKWAAKPIVFTSTESDPAAGDWVGIFLEAITASGNVIEHAVFEYAGGASGTSSFGCGPRSNDAALLIFERPDDAFIQNTTFRNNAGDTTIVSGWVSDEDGPDLVTGNEFESTGGTEPTGCLQSLWRTTETNYCPTTEGPHCAP